MSDKPEHADNTPQRRQALAMMEAIRAEAQAFSKLHQPPNPGKGFNFQRLPPERDAELRAMNIERYTEVIRLDPTLAEAYIQRGIAYKKDSPEAIADLQRAWDLKPDDPYEYLTIAHYFEGAQQREVLNEGIARTGDNAHARTMLQMDVIHTYWYEAQFEEFVRRLEELISQIDPDQLHASTALSHLAMGYGALGDHAKAEATYRRQLAICPDAEERKRSIPHMIFRTRLYREDYASARALIDEFATELQDRPCRMLRAVLDVLEQSDAPATRQSCQEVLPDSAEAAARPNPFFPRQCKTTYASFLHGLILIGAGELDEGRALLAQFAEDHAANAREWGVTLRWEIAKARQLAE